MYTSVQAVQSRDDHGTTCSNLLFPVGDQNQEHLEPCRFAISVRKVMRRTFFVSQNILCGTRTSSHAFSSSVTILHETYVRVMNQLGGQKLPEALPDMSWAPFSLDVISGPAVKHQERNKRKTNFGKIPFFRLPERYLYYGNKGPSSTQHLEIKTENHSSWDSNTNFTTLDIKYVMQFSLIESFYSSPDFSSSSSSQCFKVVFLK